MVSYIKCPVCEAVSVNECRGCGLVYCGEHQYRHPNCSEGEIIDARDNAVERAGMVQVSDIGDTESNETQVSSIHKYKNNEKCECKCHPNKLECMECYDHPIHLSKKFIKKV